MLLAYLTNPQWRGVIAKNPAVLFATVDLLDKVGERQCIVWLEGESDLPSYYPHFLSADTVIPFGGEGKDTVEQAVRCAAKAGVTCLIGIRDADCARVVGEELPEGVFITDAHDAEVTMFIASVRFDGGEERAFERILAEYADLDAVRAFEAKRGVEFLSAIMDVVLPLGALKLLADDPDSGVRGLRLNGLQTEDYAAIFTDMTNLQGSVPKAVALIHSRSPRVNRSEGELLDRVRQILTRPDVPQLVRGHDISGALAAVFAGPFGREYPVGHGEEFRMVKRTPTRSQVEQVLKDAFTSEMFAGTSLCNSILQWEQATGRRAISASVRRHLHSGD